LPYPGEQLAVVCPGIPVRYRRMWAKLTKGLYSGAAFWLAVFVAYLVCLLLPFGVGWLSSLAAALVALVLLASLVRSLVRRLLRGGPIGRWPLAIVMALAVAALTLDAGWSTTSSPSPRPNQDDCHF